MNVFYLSYNTTLCARDHCNKHCVKMIVEYAQIQSTAHWIARANDMGLLPWSGTLSSLWLHIAKKDIKPFKIDYSQLEAAYKFQRLIEALRGERNYPKKIRTLDVYRSFLKIALPDSLYANVYSPTHINHPSAVWARESIEHYRWLNDLSLDLCNEYSRRYMNRLHKTQAIHEWLRDNEPNIHDHGFVVPPQCMPDDVKIPGDTLEAYRNYYRVHKSYMAEWFQNEIPKWWQL